MTKIIFTLMTFGLAISGSSAAMADGGNFYTAPYMRPASTVFCAKNNETCASCGEAELSQITCEKLAKQGTLPDVLKGINKLKSEITALKAERTTYNRRLQSSEVCTRVERSATKFCDQKLVDQIDAAIKNVNAEIDLRKAALVQIAAEDASI